ncbi:MAG: DinB family protein [Pirellulaceae bacterium]|nr:DinB family protein [Pirellulaceae bacterium]
MEMIELYRESIANQFAAAYATLADCIERCPESAWQAPVVELTFDQVMFHVLFFSDVYLGAELAALRGQDFHRQHAEFFGDYEELEDRKQQASYSKDGIRDYLKHCREKAVSVIATETSESLAARPGFDWLDFSRAEVHVYNLRHLYHHGGQLSMRLRIDTGDGATWVRSGNV